jgi:SPP1 family predicted phage head-tail adaptor
MIRARVAELITEAPKAHGIFDTPAETTRKVYCTVKSVGQTEVYQANAIGLNPELKLILAHAFEYHGEKALIYDGERWKILRTYVNEGDQIELTIQKTDGNAAEVEDDV